MIFEKYNVIKKVCEQMKKANLDAYLREMSIEKSTLDYEKMASNPYLKLKNKRSNFLFFIDIFLKI